MTNALAWLNDLVQWLGRWIPRFVLIHPTHLGVRFGPKGGSVAVGPGLVFYWPITHDLIQVPITAQSIQLSGQVLHLANGESHMVPRICICILNVQFSIKDAVKAATRILNFHALVANRAQSAAAQYWRGDMDARGWIAPAQEQLEQEMEEFGIRIHRLDVAGFGIGCALKNISDWVYADQMNGKRPE